MLFQSVGGFIDIVIEPQFKEYTFGSQLCSVRSTDLSILKSMKNSVRGEIDFNKFDRIYPFTGYGYLDDLARELKTKSFLGSVDSAESDFTRKPATYLYLGFEEPDYWGVDGDTWQGYLYPDEVHDFQNSMAVRFDYFRVWPLFHIPASLRGSLEP